MAFDPQELSTEERTKLKENIAQLREKFSLYTRKDDLQVGDIVFWKPGLTNRRFPRPGRRPATGSSDSLPPTAQSGTVS